MLRGGALAGGDSWLPALDAFADATFHRRRMRWTLIARFFDFEGAELWIGGPGLALDLTSSLAVQAQYLRGRTRFEGGGSITSDNLTLGVHGRPTGRLRAFVEYRHGIDRLDWLTADRLTAKDADTLGIGGGLDVTPFVSLDGAYDHQKRADNITVHRARGLLLFRF
jgi:hypothetical protein